MRVWTNNEWTTVTLIAVLGLSGCGPSAPGHLSVQSARIDLTGPQPALEVALDHQFGPVLLEALSSGVPIRYAWSMQLLGDDHWLLPDTLAEQDGYLEIDYRSFTRWYTLRGLEAGGRLALPDLEQAERSLSQMRLPLTGFDWPEPVRGARFRIQLDVGHLPPPLRLPAYLSSDWRRDSGWFYWQPAGPDTAG